MSSLQGMDHDGLVARQSGVRSGGRQRLAVQMSQGRGVKDKAAP